MSEQPAEKKAPVKVDFDFRRELAEKVEGDLATGIVLLVARWLVLNVVIKERADA